MASGTIDTNKVKEIHDLYNGNMNACWKRLYIKQIPKDELSSIKLEAVWKALIDFDPSKSSLKTRVLNYFKWFCSRYIRQKYRYNKILNNIDNLNKLAYDKTVDFNILSFLDDFEYTIICDRYKKRFTLSELSERYNISISKISSILQKIKVKILQNIGV